MKSDSYTKAVLTVIAGSLLALCVENAVAPRATSAQGPQKVILAGIDLQTTLPSPVVPPPGIIASGQLIRVQGVIADSNAIGIPVGRAGIPVYVVNANPTPLASK
jgi:hypothetical protein